MLPALRFLPLLATLIAFAVPRAQAEPPLRPHDVIAFVGGEDMVAASEYGYLELLLVRALPDYQLRFRNLAWEGDTVFEQRRDLNFPPLETQLDKIGATVVIAQFGQMESFAGKEKLPEFIAAYEKLIARMRAGGKRRVFVLTPNHFSGDAGQKGVFLGTDADMQIAKLGDRATFIGGKMVDHSLFPSPWRDSVHLSVVGQTLFASYVATDLLAEYINHGGPQPNTEVRLPHLVKLPASGESIEAPAEEGLRQIIRAKNKLWFNYWRPQNWAFLNGDRTSQPSSRDHLDPSKRWFPDEIEQFIPLIEGKEREIDMLAKKLAK